MPAGAILGEPATKQLDGIGGFTYHSAVKEYQGVPQPIVMVTDWREMNIIPGREFTVCFTVADAPRAVVLNRSQATHLRDYLNRLLGEE